MTIYVINYKFKRKGDSKYNICSESIDAKSEYDARTIIKKKIDLNHPGYTEFSVINTQKAR
jgi:hypothetical protein